MFAIPLDLPLPGSFGEIREKLAPLYKNVRPNFYGQQVGLNRKF